MHCSALPARDLVEDTQIGVCVVQHEHIGYVNPAACEMFGRRADEMLGQRHEIMLAHESYAVANAILLRRLAGKAGRGGPMRCRRLDGSTFRARCFARVIEWGDAPAVLLTVIDLTELQEALDKAEWSAGMLARTEALCRAGSFEIEWPALTLTLSPGLHGLLGLAPGPCRDGIAVLPWVPADEQAFVAGIWQSAVDGEPFEFQHRVLHNDGRRLIVLHRGVRNGSRGIALLQDITAQREAERRIQELASHDEVTGLPNRAWLLDQLDAALHDARRDPRAVALLALEVPRIADIRTGMGYGAGNTLAMALAARLREACAAGETIAHIGDTEFALLVAAGDASRPAIDRRAQALQQALQAPVRLGATDVFPLCRIGIALHPADGDRPDALLDAAQAARLDVAGGAGIAFFCAETNTRAVREMRVEAALRHAIAHDEFTLHYQPQVDLRSGAMRGAEALLRWRSADLGIVGPNEFIPIAERTGLIGAIGEWVIRGACRQVAAWQLHGLPVGRVAVNLSPAQLQRPDLVRWLEGVLAETGASPSHLGVELTESMLMADVDRAAEVLRGIKAIGIEVSLDDFGTGYSSLNSLARLPIDTVKLDRSLVHDATAASQQVSLMRAIINMAHGLSMQVLAEGVETEGQLSLLVSQHCDQMQGFWFSRPLPADGYAALLAAGHRLDARHVTRAGGSRTLLAVGPELATLAVDGCRVVTARDSSDALLRLTEHRIDVVVTAQQLPASSGIALLRRAKTLVPETVRIVLADHGGDMAPVVDAVNDGSVHRFLTQPCSIERLQSHVAEALRHKALADENRHLMSQVEATNGNLAQLNTRLERLLQQQRRQSALLTASAEGARDLLDDLPAAVLGIDPDGVVAYANRAASALFAQHAGLLGRPALELLPGAAATVQVNGRMHRLLTGKMSGVNEGADATDRGRLVMLVPSDGADAGAVTTSTNETDMNHAAAAADVAQARAAA